jgi:tetrahydromethanopterin S-methyltransferase subunit C
LVLNGAIKINRSKRYGLKNRIPDIPLVAMALGILGWGWDFRKNNHPALAAPRHPS